MRIKQFMPFFFFLLLLMPRLVWSTDVWEGAGALATPQFESAMRIRSESGYFQLEWALPQTPQGLNFELQVALDKEFKDFRVLYRGADTASFVSGLLNGTYYYRVRAFEPTSNLVSKWSTSVQAIVEHHSLHLAFTLFSIGLLVVCATVWLVVSGSKGAGS